MFYIKIITYLLIVSLITLLVMDYLNQRTVDPTIIKLLEVELIKREQVKELKMFLKENDGKSRTSYLQGLNQLEINKFFGGSNFGFPVHYYSFKSFDLQNTNEVEQKNINDELLNYLAKLYTIKLISERLYDIQSDKINNNVYIHLLQMLEDLSNQSVYEEWFNPENIIIYAEELLSNNIINDKAAKKLKNDAFNNKIESHYQIIDYYKNAIFKS